SLSTARGASWQRAKALALTNTSAWPATQPRGCSTAPSTSPAKSSPTSAGTTPKMMKLTAWRLTAWGGSRYNSDSFLETNFNPGGTKPGTVLTDFSGGSNTSDDRAFAVAIDSLDRIVVAGFSSVNGSHHFALARYTALGALDTAFNSAGALPGTVVTDFT